MRAARLYPGERRLRLEDVPVPEPTGGQILLRVAGTGVCHSDLHLLDDPVGSEFLHLPVTLGHEIAGWVHDAGSEVSGIEIGEPVVVLCVCGCGRCEWCSAGHHELCERATIAGAMTDGGFAEYVLVPRRDRLVSLGALDPVEAAPLADAALTPYRALQRIRDRLSGDSTVVVIGIGGLGEYAVQLAQIVADARVIAVDVREDRLDRAAELGADHCVASGLEAAAEILGYTGSKGAEAVIDLVGTDESLGLSAAVVGRRGTIVLVGAGGGSIPLGFRTLAPEASFTTLLSGGTARYLAEVVELAQAGRIRGQVSTYPLEAVNEALEDLRAGGVEGRAVVTPNGDGRA